MMLKVREIDDRKMLRILSPVFIWGIFIIAMLVVIGNAPDFIALPTVALMVVAFLMIVPIFIRMHKNSTEFRKQQLKSIHAEFEIRDDNIYLNKREVVITFNHSEDGKEILSVVMLFDKFSGYSLTGAEAESFVKYAEENQFPINVTGRAWPKNK